MGEPVGEGGAEGGWVGGCGTLRRPRDSGLGQEAERVGANMRTSFNPLSLRFLKNREQNKKEIDEIKFYWLRCKK